MGKRDGLRPLVVAPQALVGVKEYAIDPEQAQRLWALLASLTGIDAFA